MTRTRDDSTPDEKTPILGTKKLGCLDAFPARYAFALLGFFGLFTSSTMTVNLNVAMVAMVRKPMDANESTVTCLELLTYAAPNATTSEYGRKHLGEFDWDSSTQGLILGAFFYGYFATQIPAGIIAERYGSKWILGIGLLVISLFTLLTPIAARWSVGALVAARVIEGLAGGVIIPAMNALIGRWVPKMERSRISTFVFCGGAFGTVLSLSISGILSNSTFLGGWPSVFYVFGTIGCIWFLFWITLIHESPDEHPRITKEELEYIHQGQDHGRNRNGPKPWCSIVTSVPLWALLITDFGYHWGNYILLTDLPTYLSNVLHFNLKKNGVLSSLPYLLQAFFGFIASFLADKMRATERFKITTIRKIMNSIGFYGPGCIILGVAFVGCDPLTSVILLTISVGLSGFKFSGFNVTHIDMSPEFAGTLMGITNCIGNTAGFLAPAYVGWIIEDGQTLQNWGIVFVTASVVYFVTGTVFNIFGSAELQPWGVTEKPTAYEAKKSKNKAKQSVTRQ